MGFFKKLLGFHDIEVSANMTVAELQFQFEEQFGTKIRVYKPTAKGTINTGKGARLASAEDKLGSISLSGTSISNITIQKNKSVDTVEKEFATKMGVGVQIMTPDGNTFAPNNMILSKVRSAYADQ